MGPTVLLLVAVLGRDVGSQYPPLPAWHDARCSDVVVVATVTATEPDAHAVWYPAVGFFRPEAVRRQPVVVLDVNERLLGRLGPDVLRAGLFEPLAVGDRRLFLLGPPQAGGVRPTVSGPWRLEAVPAAGVRQACRVLADPLGSLTGRTRADRYFAAAVLTDRRLFGGRELPPEQARLLLRAVADLPDWSAPPDGAYTPALLLTWLGVLTPAGEWPGLVPPGPPPADPAAVTTTAAVVRVLFGPAAGEGLEYFYECNQLREAFHHWLDGRRGAGRLPAPVPRPAPGGWQHAPASGAMRRKP